MIKHYTFVQEFMDEFKIKSNNFNAFKNAAKQSNSNNPNIGNINKQYNKSIYGNTGSAIGSAAGILSGAAIGNYAANKITGKQYLKQLKTIIYQSDNILDAYREYRSILYNNIPSLDRSFRKIGTKDPQWKEKLLKRINIQLASGTILGTVGGSIAGRYIGKALGNTIGSTAGNLSNKQNLKYDKTETGGINQSSHTRWTTLQDPTRNYNYKGYRSRIGANFDGQF